MVAKRFPLLLVWLTLLVGCAIALPHRLLLAQANFDCFIILSDISVAHNAQQDAYLISFSIGSDYTCVNTIVLDLAGEDGLQITRKVYNAEGQDNFQLSYDGAGLKPGKYRIGLTPLKVGDEPFTIIDNNEIEIIRGQAEFVRREKQAEPIAVTIQAATAHRESASWVIDVDISREEAIASYSGFVVDKESGSKVDAFGPKLYTQRQLIEPINDPALLQSPEVREYTINLFMLSRNDEQSTATYDFKVAAAPIETWWNKVTKALRDQYVQGAILLVVLGVAGWVVAQNAQGKKERGLPPPPIEGTGPVPRTARRDAGNGYKTSQASRLRVRVIRSKGGGESPKRTLNQFPCTIGSEGCDIKIDDSYISRRHAEINHRGGAFYITDLGSRNGTFIASHQLEPHQPMRISGVTLVQFGPHTEIELEPLD